MLPPSLGSSSGSSVRQRSCAFQQRVWKRHAGGGLVGDGTSPASSWRLRTLRRVGHRHGRHQRAGVRMPRVRVELRRVGVLDDLAEVHHGHAVAHVAHDREVVGDEDERQAEVALQVA